LQIPRLLKWLSVAGGIRCTARQHMLARRCIPLEQPCAPRERSQRLAQRRLAPGAVYADLDTDDRCHSRPRPTADLDAPTIERASAREEVGKARRNQERAWPDPLNRLSRVVGAALVPVRDALLITVEPSGQCLDPNQPLDMRHSIPTRN